MRPLAPLAQPPHYSEHAILLRSKLVLSEQFYARVIVAPSFAPEWVVTLKKVKVRSDPDDPFSEEVTKGHELSVAIAKKNIYMEGGAANGVEVVVKSRWFPASLGNSIESAFDEMLVLTNYRAAADRGLDGVCYEFSDGHRHGRTWTPQKGLAADFAVLAEKLREFGLATEIEIEDGLLASMSEQVELIRDRLKSIHEDL